MTSPKTSPAISVVMPVHNALPYLDEAVGSILAQTRTDFEFVIYDDGSTDGSWERLEHWARQDKRIALFRGKCNVGPVKSSNAVVRHASAPLIARMDADDVSMPDRLELQSRALVENPDAGMVGSLCEVMDSSGRKLRRLARAPWLTPFPHGSMMVRRELFDGLGGYRDECVFWEDLDFIFRAARESRVLIVPRPLYLWRHSGGGTRLASDQARVENALDLRYRSVARIRQGRSYEDLLEAGPRREGEQVDPRVFVSLGLLELWAHKRPRVARRFFRRARMRLDLPTAISLAWVSWASVSPASLRALMKLQSRLRALRQPGGASEATAVEWRPPPVSIRRS